MAHSKRHLNIFLGFLAGILTCTQAFCAAEKQFKDTFRLIALTDNPVFDLFYDLKGKPIPVEALTADMSTNYKLPSGDVLQFYIPIPVPPGSPPEIKPGKKIVAEVSLVSLVGPVLFILEPAPTGSAIHYKVGVLNISVDNQPSDSALFFNRSKTQLAASFNRNQFILEPGQSRLVPYGEVHSETTGLAIAAFRGSEWVPVSQATLPVVKKSRALIFCVEAQGVAGILAGIKVIVIKDMAPPIEEKSDGK